MKNTEFQINQLHRSIELANHTINLMLVLFIFLLIIFVLREFSRKKELDFTIKKAKIKLNQLKIKETELELVRPKLSAIIKHMLYTSESLLFYYNSHGLKDKKLINKFEIKYRLNVHHVSLTYYDPKNNLAALDQLIVVGQKETLEFINLFESILENNKESDSYHILKIKCRTVREYINVKLHESKF